MPSASELAERSKANAGLRQLVTSDVRRIWTVINISDAVTARNELSAVLPSLIAQYGDVAATVAADAYATNRDAARVRSRYVVQLADPPLVEQVEASVRWAVSPLFSEIPQPDETLGRLISVADRMTLRQGDETISLNVRQDPARPRYAWAPHGATCAFCTLKASRGAVYWSQAAATAGRHDKCDCVATQVFDGDDLGYDPEVYYGEYREAADAVGTGRTKDVLAKMREQQSIH